MAFEIHQYVDWFPLASADFNPYLRGGVPRLNVDKLNLDLLKAADRGNIERTPVTGDYSFYLSYKGRDGAVASFTTEAEELVVLQLQGGKPHGYRVTTAMDWVGLFGDQVARIVSHPASPFRRLVVPDLPAIPHLFDIATDHFYAVRTRYERFIARVGLTYSGEERQYVRDLR